MKHPDQAELLEETYDDMESRLVERITGLQNQITLNQDRRNLMIRVNRKAKTALDVFDDILKKDHLDSRDLTLLVEEIVIFEDHIDVKLKADIDALLTSGEAIDEETGKAVNFKWGTEGKVTLVQRAKNTLDKVFCVNTVSDGDRLHIYGVKGEIHSPVQFNQSGEIPYTVIRDGKTETKTVSVPNNYRLEIEQLGRCVRNGETPWVTKDFSLRCAGVMDAILSEIGY